MNFKVALALLFASVAMAVPGQVQHDSNVLARDPQRGPVRPSGPSCCSYIPGDCNCGCCSGGPCATFNNPDATCP
ncbi:hypothetical protein CH063_02054 [Colletotrichum higginsianum]|uniref:Uncharacterized protein n=1 Tax=Colletotrichum higginsianum (strain IMI 349063) TaxID=759273 RepID=H1VFQ8_COLHI|nr:hypothetical protein CH63R_06773 [Colletotrichum higginsianum IMI 349063]OBR11081.1 hypothetical protein CH63R_06773 [Colletotrichum higginsianum IMI 349063]CCF39061.1 hypothetical protein CH063_02054 [Colletotrichum higginsianum]